MRLVRRPLDSRGKTRATSDGGRAAMLRTCVRRPARGRPLRISRGPITDDATSNNASVAASTMVYTGAAAALRAGRSKAAGRRNGCKYAKVGCPTTYPSPRRPPCHTTPRHRQRRSTRLPFAHVRRGYGELRSGRAVEPINRRIRPHIRLQRARRTIPPAPTITTKP
ncbi:hypothetical protein HPB50_004438 [Hyalomma asiaticum]|uniref:Uncharacterized protein n=1 Tax=Hyalomma asiaticum TaxID=266040 RepID=A0ACB7TEV9_HYAAI|nr:hypothetical protein HPB50_004438 [Hyalomma asiaticum]